MTTPDNKADWNSASGKPPLKQVAAHEVDPEHADVKRDEALGRVEIAPAKPLWPSTKCLVRG